MKRDGWIRRHPAVILALVVFTSAFILLAVLEKVCELKNRGTRRYARGIERHIRLREHRPHAFQEIYPDEYFFRNLAPSLQPRKFSIRIDGDGFIVPSGEHADPDLKIVFLGASTTECLLNDEKRRFPYVVGKILEERTNLKVNSYNGGRGGNNTLHSIDIFLNKIIPMDPEFVVLKHNMNDLIILILEKSYWNDNPKRSPIVVATDGGSLRGHLVRALRNLAPNLAFEAERFSHRRVKVRAVENEFRRHRGKKAIIDRERILAEFRMNLDTFVEICRIRGITPVLMTQANMMGDEPDELTRRLTGDFAASYGIPYEQFKAIYDSFNQAIRDTAEQHDVVLIDLDSRIPKDRRYVYDLIHFTDAGSELAATAIAEELLKVIEQDR